MKTCNKCGKTEAGGAKFYKSRPKCCTECLKAQVAESQKADRALYCQQFTKHLKGHRRTTQTRRIHNWIRDGQMNLAEFRGVMEILQGD